MHNIVPTHTPDGQPLVDVRVSTQERTIKNAVGLRRRVAYYQFTGTDEQGRSWSWTTLKQPRQTPINTEWQLLQQGAESETPTESSLRAARQQARMVQLQNVPQSLRRVAAMFSW